MPIIIGFVLIVDPLAADTAAWHRWFFNTVAASHFLITAFILRHFWRDPRPNVKLRVVGTAADHVGIVASMAVSGPYSVIASWLPLFITTGVSVRFGVRYLAPSYLVSLVDLSIVYWLNPYWHANPLFTAGIFLTTGIVPIYLGMLAKREDRIKRELQLERAAAETARFEAEEAKQQAEQQRAIAESASAAKTQFLATMSHELRTPLTGIVGINEILLEGQHSREHQHLLTQQRDASTLMLATVNDILDISKVEAGEMKPEHVEFDFYKLIREVCSGLGYQAHAKGVALRTVIDSAMPSQVNGSPFHVTRIVQNLLSNAIKFTKAGSVTLRLLHSERREAGRIWVRLEVEDTGIGIPKEAVDRIFDRFYQADASVTRKFGGTGLGTTIVKEFVDLLGGTIKLESTLGVGSRFAVEIPFVSPEQTCSECAVSQPLVRLLAFGLSIDELEKLSAVTNALGVVLLTVQDAVDIAAAIRDLRRQPSVEVVIGISRLDADLPKIEAELSEEQIQSIPWIAIVDVTEIAVMPSTSVPADLVCLSAVDDRMALLRAIGAAHATVSASARAAAVIDTLATNGTESTLNGLHILIAEDTAVIQSVYKNMLIPRGHKLTCASDGEEALEYLSSYSFDLVMLDWHMPKMDGLTVLRALRASHGLNQKVPVVVSTAAPSPDLIVDCKRAGADEVIGKPFKKDLLLAMIDKFASKGSTRTVPVTTAMYTQESSDTSSSHSASMLLDRTFLEAPGSLFLSSGAEILKTNFVNDCRTNSSLLAKSVAANDFAQFREVIHALQGYAATFGAMRLVDDLAKSPQTAEAFAREAVGSSHAISSTIDATIVALDDWLRERVDNGLTTD